VSYSSITQCVTDQAFLNRLNACIAQEQIAKDETPSPTQISSQLMWAVACADDVESAYESALAAYHPNPGGDASVITDEMILSHVQGSWPPEPQPQPGVQPLLPGV